MNNIRISRIRLERVGVSCGCRHFFELFWIHFFQTYRHLTWVILFFYDFLLYIGRNRERRARKKEIWIERANDNGRADDGI